MFTQEKKEKILKCQGCAYKCSVDAHETKFVRHDGVEIVQYVPVINNKVISVYTNETGANIRPKLEYRVEAILEGLRIAKLCDRYQK